MAENRLRRRIPPKTFKELLDELLDNPQMSHHDAQLLAKDMHDNAMEDIFRLARLGEGIWQMSGEQLARMFHETYERLAPEHDYKTRKASAVAWDDVPEQNRTLMISTATAVLDRIQKYAFFDGGSDAT